MKTIDYIIVGCGLGGIAFCEQLRRANKSFVVFDNHSQQSSKVAAGLYNPVILKRFTKVWQAKDQLKLAMPKYRELEELLDVKLNHSIPVYRKFMSIEEQNQWVVASDKPALCDFMSPDFIKNTNPNINADYGFGEVLHSGRINSSLLVTSYIDYLQKKNVYISEEFQHSELQIEAETVSYKTISAKHIVFAEGFGLNHNPFFDDLPLVGSKGEMLTIKAPELKLNVILKSAVFLVPLGDDLYWVGATYEREDKTHMITESAKTQLVDKVKKILNCDFEVIHQVAGIRPTTKDRRPLVGVHPIHKNMYLLNGLGTRGVMISPFVAQQLYNHIEIGMVLDSEIDIQRYYRQ